MKKKEIIVGGLLLLGLVNSNNKNSRHSNYSNYYNNYIYSNNTIKKDHKNKVIIYLQELNKTGYLVNRRIHSGSNLYIHTLHLVNSDNTLFAIYKATSNDSDFSSAQIWQKVVGYNAPYFIKGDLRYNAVLYN